MQSSVHQLDFAWADRRWTDPLTGTEVVLLSPDEKKHFRNNYFRVNMFTADGRYALFSEQVKPTDGPPLAGPNRLWARDLVSGDLRDLGEIPLGERTHFFLGGVWCLWAVSPRSHIAYILDESDPETCAIIQVDIDTGARRRITPREKIPLLGGAVSADDRYAYGVWLKEKWHLHRAMECTDFFAMLVAQPGYQEMIRVDLQTGDVEPVFSATTWWMGHQNPHPTNPDLFMCCQEAAGGSDKWGSPTEFERIRVMYLPTRQWLNTHRSTPMQSSHEHWALAGRRIYAHVDRHGIHLINRIDLDTGENAWFASPPDTGASDHVRIAPNERFLVGDGHNFDRYMVPPDIKARLEALPTTDLGSSWAKRDARRWTNGGETIWKYVLPEESVWNYDLHANDSERLHADLQRYPEKTVRTTPICRFRTLARSHMFGRRVESNAHVTPDSRWVVFQSSSEDDYFQVWAARIPET